MQVDIFRKNQDPRKGKENKPPFYPSAQVRKETPIYYLSRERIPKIYSIHPATSPTAAMTIPAVVAAIVEAAAPAKVSVVPVLPPVAI